MRRKELLALLELLVARGAWSGVGCQVTTRAKTPARKFLERYSVVPKVAERFRTGKGAQYSDCPREMFEAIERAKAPAPGPYTALYEMKA
ncbi:MAG: hypothetical protein HY238_14115 [Acidobacteria bacterium]|nr:hypothetical protein [Acidobacteriota bacterium]